MLPLPPHRSRPALFSKSPVWCPAVLGLPKWGQAASIAADLKTGHLTHVTKSVYPVQQMLAVVLQGEGYSLLQCQSRVLKVEKLSPTYCFLAWAGETEEFDLCACLICSPLGSASILGLKGYVAERKGEREDMQDAHVILNDITEECQPLPSQM